MIELSSHISTRFTRLYKQLVASDLRRELLGAEPQALPPQDLAYLVSTASRLALSSETDSELAGAECQLAYDVAVRATQSANGSRAAIAPLCEGILSRLGNFPARSLLRARTVDVQSSRDPFLEIESRVREEENRVNDAPQGVMLTDFQVRLLRALRAKSSVSVSAPTSAGKSFTLELDLLHRLKRPGPYVAVFIVPTRALIRQVSLDLSDLLRANSIDCLVLSSLAVPDAPAGTVRRLIFVFTQERLATFLGQMPPDLKLNALVIDEAQEIGKDRRGITLERVIRLSTRRFPDVQLFFSSPLRSNPGYLLSIFGRLDSSSAHFVEYQRPVTQNLILIKSVKGRTDSADLEVLTDVGMVTLGTADLPFKFRGRYVVNLAKHFTAPDDVSIIYCNRPSEAEKTASELSELFEERNDDQLDEFADFLRQEVHRYYRLGRMVQKGVAFHYANIPQIVRSRIEELAKQRKLRFVCCTSTLLQGVNLPAPRTSSWKIPRPGGGKRGKSGPATFGT